MNAPDAPRVGFFGKLPARGDFVRAGLSRASVSAWDAWLQATLPASHALPARDPASRAWRLALAPGLCGPSALCGLLLPSTDKVGRSFPLLLAMEDGTADDLLLDALEAIGRTAIEERHDPGVLAEAIRRLPLSPPGGQAHGEVPSRWWRRTARGLDEVTGVALPDRPVLTMMLTT